MASQSSADFTSVYFYNPSLAAAIIFTILYFIPAVVLLWQTCILYKDWRLLCLPIGAWLEVGGYICRSYSIQHPTNISAYAVSLSLIVLAPLFIAAANYITIGRLITGVLPADSQTILGLPCRKISKIFVICDILSFLVQASGSGIASSNNWQGNSEKIGVDVLIAGLATQLVTVLVFAVLLGTFTNMVFAKGRAKDTAPSGWKRVHMAICISILFIAVRSVYRLIEFILGIDGYPFSHEWIFYVFESLPMLPAIGIFCIHHPGKYLPRKKDLGVENMADGGKE